MLVFKYINVPDWIDPIQNFVSYISINIYYMDKIEPSNKKLMGLLAFDRRRKIRVCELIITRAGVQTSSHQIKFGLFWNNFVMEIRAWFLVFFYPPPTRVRTDVTHHGFEKWPKTRTHVSIGSRRRNTPNARFKWSFLLGPSHLFSTRARRLVGRCDHLTTHARVRAPTLQSAIWMHQT